MVAEIFRVQGLWPADRIGTRTQVFYERSPRLLGRHPAELDQLAPSYLATIPERWGDTPFDYSQSESGKDFSLEYADAPMGTLPNDGFHAYRASSGKW